jgi:hypothetical protein
MAIHEIGAQSVPAGNTQTARRIPCYREWLRIQSASRGLLAFRKRGVASAGLACPAPVLCAILKFAQ